MQLVISSATQYYRWRTVGGRNESGMPCIVLVALMSIYSSGVY